MRKLKMETPKEHQSTAVLPSKVLAKPSVPSTVNSEFNAVHHDVSEQTPQKVTSFSDSE